MPYKKAYNVFRPSLLRNEYNPPADETIWVVLNAAPTSQTTTPSPRPPSPWVWICHLCDTSYAVGVTRRCLHDGHKMCYRPKTIVGKSLDHKKFRHCESIFDYSGWSGWQDWRRQQFLNTTTSERDCWMHCNYPSKCRGEMRHSKESARRRDIVC